MIARCALCHDHPVRRGETFCAGCRPLAASMVKAIVPIVPALLLIRGLTQIHRRDPS